MNEAYLCEPDCVCGNRQVETGGCLCRDGDSEGESDVRGDGESDVAGEWDSEGETDTRGDGESEGNAEGEWEASGEGDGNRAKSQHCLWDGSHGHQQEGGGKHFYICQFGFVYLLFEIVWPH